MQLIRANPNNLSKRARTFRLATANREGIMVQAMTVVPYDYIIRYHLIMVHGYRIGPFIYYQMTCDSTDIGPIRHSSLKWPFNSTGTYATIGLLGTDDL